MDDLTALKIRLEEVKAENRTYENRCRPIDEQTRDICFEAGFEAAIMYLETYRSKND